MDDKSYLALVAEQFRPDGQVTLSRDNGMRLVRLAERETIIERHEADLRQADAPVRRPTRRQLKTLEA
jgi:hypothetical protein